jgi:hypothetical protein
MSNAALEPDHVAAAQLLWYGHHKVRPHSELELCWKAAKAIAAGDGIVSDDERIALVGKMTAAATPESVVEAVLAWDEHTETATELLAHLRLPDELRRELGVWMVYEGLSAGLADGHLGFGEIGIAHEVALAMGVPLSTVHALIPLCSDEAALRLRRIRALKAPVSAEAAAPVPSNAPVSLVCAAAAPAPASPSASGLVSSLAYEPVPATMRGDSSPPGPVSDVALISEQRRSA